MPYFNAEGLVLFMVVITLNNQPVLSNQIRFSKFEFVIILFGFPIFLLLFDQIQIIGKLSTEKLAGEVVTDLSKDFANKPLHSTNGTKEGQDLHGRSLVGDLHRVLMHLYLQEVLHHVFFCLRMFQIVASKFNLLIIWFATRVR